MVAGVAAPQAATEASPEAATGASPQAATEASPEASSEFSYFMNADEDDSDDADVPLSKKNFLKNNPSSNRKDYLKNALSTTSVERRSTEHLRKAEEELPEPPTKQAALSPLIIIIMRVMLTNLCLNAHEACDKLKTNMNLLLACVIDSCCVGLTLTTACSGTDLVSPVLTAFFVACCDCLDSVPLQVQHLWSCENTAWKARWISRVVGMETVFTDIHQLPFGRAATHASSVAELVSSGILHVVGFSCKSVSLLNSQRRKYLKCIRKGAGTTGGTFWSSWRYARKYLPVLMWLENVASFNGANLRLLVKLLRALGYSVVVLVLDLSLHGVPCRRKRTWILAKLDPSNCSVAACTALQAAADQLELSLRQPMQALDSFLFADDALPQQQPGRKRNAEGAMGAFAKRIKWRATHAAMWAEKGFVVPTQLPEPLQAMVVQEELSKREADVILFDVVAHRDKYSDKERILDVSQSIGRYPSGTNICPTITPNARMCLINRDHPRLMLGQERLRLQGFDASMASDPSAISDFTNRPSIYNNSMRES